MPRPTPQTPEEQPARHRIAPVWWVLAAVILVGFTLRYIHLGDVPVRSPDEAGYTYFAARIADSGISSTPALFEEFLAKPDFQSYPAPTRLTYPLLEALVMRIAEVGDANAGVAVSFIFSVLSLGLMAWIGLRFFGPWTAVASTAFLAFSVCELAMSRRAWQDSAFSFLGLLVLLATCEISTYPKVKRWYPIFAGLGALALLTKQTGVILYGVCGLWLLYRLLAPKGERMLDEAKLLVLWCAGSLVVTMAIWSLAAGGFGTAITALRVSIQPGEAGMKYVMENSSCPWYEFVYLLFVVGPAPFLLSIVGAVVVVRGWRSGNGAMGGAGMPALVLGAAFVLFASCFPLMQNLRYISPADGALSLLAAIGFMAIASRVRHSKPALAAAGAVLVVALFHDYDTFRTAIVQPNILDLAFRLLRNHAG